MAKKKARSKKPASARKPPARKKRPSGPGTDTFQVIKAGQYYKQSETQPIPFGHTFTSPPYVVVTSQRLTGGVQYPENIKSISNDGFVLYSGNYAPDYMINWVAVGY